MQTIIPTLLINSHTIFQFSLNCFVNLDLNIIFRSSVSFTKDYSNQEIPQTLRVPYMSLNAYFPFQLINFFRTCFLKNLNYLFFFFKINCFKWNIIWPLNSVCNHTIDGVNVDFNWRYNYAGIKVISVLLYLFLSIQGYWTFQFSI